MARDWWKPYKNEVVGYVIEKKGKFMPCLATCVLDFGSNPDDADDCILAPIGSGPKFGAVEEALRFFEDHAPGIEVKEIFPKPIPPGMCGFSFLIEPYMALHGQDPRRTVN